MSDVSCLVNYKIQKMKKLRLFFVTLFFVLTNISSLYSATTYPIQLTAQLLPPYGNRLSDYVVDGMERINITALQRDLSWGYYDFYLQMQVKQGSNILLSASAQYRIAPGFVTQLQANTLFSRLAEVKASKPQIIENGFCLPEGAYEFVFQAFDATKRNLPVSEPAYCYAYLNKMQPCRCLVPADNSCVDYTSPVLNFMWVEPTVAMPSTSKKYELEIYEMPQGFDPIRDNAESLLQSLEPIYTKSDISSDMTMAQVPQTAGLFVKGRSYVWRVRTRFGEKYTETTTGSYKLSNYIENNGYSKISTFHFKKCMGQEDIWSEKKKVIATDPTMKVDIEKVETDKSKVDVVWTNDDKFTCGYVVEWNLADTTKSPWGKISVGAGNSRCEIKGVRHGIEYVTRVRGMVCPKEGSKDTIYSAYSDTLHFLWEKEKGEYCGREVPVLQGSISLKSLQSGDWFTANGNDIKVLSCEMNPAGDTTFSGKGQVSYGFLTNVVSLMVEFNNVKINEQGELMEGVVYSVTDLNNCVDFNLNGLANKNSAGSGPAQMQSDFDFSNGFKDGSVGVEMRGETTTLVAKDGNGGSYEIGQLVEQEPINCAPKSNIFDDEQGLVKFAPQKAWNPPFDYEQGVFTKSLSISDYYEKIDRYSIPWIAVPSGESTKIYANLNLSAGVVKPEHVYFICRTNSKAIKLKAEKLDGNQFVVPIFGGEAGKYLELVAMADTSKNGDADCSQLFTLGRAKVLSMKKESYTLHILPFRRDKDDVNGTSIENTLNEIYKPLGKTFTVVVENRFGDGEEYNFVTEGLTVEGSGFMTTETQNMSLLKALYNAENNFKTGNHAYLFLLPESATEGVAGDMPRNKPVGYVFADPSVKYGDGYTVAHEIGHGLFTFDHAFEYYDGNQGSSTNVMDYSSSYESPYLKVWQWNLMDTHPNYVLPFFEDDESSMLVKSAEDVRKEILRKAYQRCVEMFYARPEGTNIMYFSIEEMEEASNNSLENVARLVKIKAKPSIGYVSGFVDYTNDLPDFDFENNRIVVKLPTESYESLITGFFINGNFSMGDFILYVGSDGKIYPCQMPYFNKENYKKANLADLLEQHVKDNWGFCAQAYPILTEEERAEEQRRVKTMLNSLSQQFRNTQKVELVSYGQAYRLNSAGELEQSSLSDDDIVEGKFADSEEYYRFYEDEDGVLQLSSYGISRDLIVCNGKTANKQELSREIKEMANAFLKKNQVKDPEQKPTTNIESDAFPDGDKVRIDNSASYFKVLGEVGGIAMTFLKTSELEKVLYYEDPSKIEEGADLNHAIHAPPIATGVVEGVGQKVTDITSMCATAYGLVVDEEKRQEAINGMVELKNKVADNPSSLLHILKDAVVASVTSSTTAELEEMKDENTDEGRRGHLAARTGTSTAVFAIEMATGSGAIWSSVSAVLTRKISVAEWLKKFELPKINDLTAKIESLGDDAKNFLKDFENATKEVIQQFSENPNLVDSWRLIRGKHPVDCLDIDVLRSVDDLRSLDVSWKSKCGFTDDVIADLKGAFYGPENISTVEYKGLLNTCKNFVETVGKTENNIELTNFARTLEDLTKGQSFTAGAEWTLRYVSKNANEFKGQILSFELVENVGGAQRRVDMISWKGSVPHFYEFKSVKSVPPTDFLTQFGKDLANPEVNKLSQIKWVFDGKKNPVDFQTIMQNEIRKMDIDAEVFSKFGVNSAEALKNKIINQFGDIFVLAE